MKKLLTIFFSMLFFIASAEEKSLKANFKEGNPNIKSINAMTFGPEGILFIGDSKSASIVALDTKDAKSTEAPAKIEMKNVDVAIAAALGTTADKISIQDMVVNPLSNIPYFAVHNQDGTPVLLKLVGDKIEWVPLDKVSYSSRGIENAYAEDYKDDRGRAQRVWTVSDIEYKNGKVMVTGLSNAEFSSTFRSMAFPFGKSQDDASLEIYHAAHGRFETYAPVKTFTTGTINGKDYLVASYTCTPLVLFPMDELKGGKHIKGRTVAEFGAGNTPLDMVVIDKGGESFLLMANSNRSVMKVRFSDIAGFEGSLTEPIEEPGKTGGVNFIALPMVNVVQLDKLGDKNFVMLKREANGDLNLITGNDFWL
ncbi:MAG: hypothetical protein RIB71_04895 [Imperialibacter sp.]|jgi:hypothetical protein|uniref:hypothetical protein n=1 Tax=Imperialibacter sp. TaxID=2038411 RepID=UPI0032EFD300